MARGGYHYFEPLRDEDQVTPCRIAGHFPWLPPTPAPTGRTFLNPEPERTPYRQEGWEQRRDRKLPPFRAVKEWHAIGSWAINKTTWLCHLECGHSAVKQLKVRRTPCPQCPREMR